MTITDNLPAVRNAANLPAINVASTEVSVLRATDRFYAALVSAHSGGRHRLVNPWKPACVVAGGAAIAAAIGAVVTARLAPDHIGHGALAVLTALVLLLGALGMHGRYGKRVSALPSFKPVTKS